MKWKIYFFLLVIQAIGTISVTIIYGPIHLMDVTNWLFILVALVGLHCYVYEKSFVDKKIYKVFTPMLIIWDTLFILWWIPLSIGAPILTVDTTTKVLFLFLVPQYIGLFLYGYGKPEAKTN